MYILHITYKYIYVHICIHICRYVLCMKKNSVPKVSSKFCCIQHTYGYVAEPVWNVVYLEVLLLYIITLLYIMPTMQKLLFISVHGDNRSLDSYREAVRMNILSWIFQST
jgi:hypothetical protein